MTARLGLGLVIFDCDGVLIDSEPVSRRLLVEEAHALGWPMAEADAHRMTGLSWTAIQPIFEAALGRSLPLGWPLTLQERLIVRMAGGVAAIAGARDVLEAVTVMGLPYRIASNSSRGEMVEKFGGTGLAPLVAGRVHSARDVARGKPAPDVFLAAAAAEGMAPSRCLVVEDSAPGMAGAFAAGMRVVAFAPDGLPPGLPQKPHHVITRLDALPALLAHALREQAA